MSPRVGYIYSRDSCNGCLKSDKATQTMVVMDFGKGTTLSVRLCMTCSCKLSLRLQRTIGDLQKDFEPF